MTPKSAKAKGRNLQNWVRNQFIKLGFLPGDVKTAIMGEPGADVKFSPAVEKAVPYHIECKSRQKFAIYTIYKKAQESIKGEKPILLVIKQNKERPLVVVDAEDFFEIYESQLTSMGY